jgi:hypothetical protein
MIAACEGSAVQEASTGVSSQCQQESEMVEGEGLRPRILAERGISINISKIKWGFYDGWGGRNFDFPFLIF